MAKVVLYKQGACFQLGIQRHFKREQRAFQYLSLNVLSSKDEDFLRDHNGSVLDSSLMKIDPEWFIRSYSDVVGQMCWDNKGLFWWATDISSKNRFTSKLALWIEKYIKAIKAAEGAESNLFVFGVPEEIFYPLYRYFNNKERKCFGGLRQGLLRFKWGSIAFLKSVLGAFKHFFCVLQRVVYVKRHLRDVIERTLDDGRIYYVIKSFFYDKSLTGSGEYQDSFFGGLPGYINSKRPMLVFVNILGDFKASIHKIKDFSKHLIIPLEYFLTWQDILKYVFRVTFYKVNVKRIQFGKYDITDIVRNELIKTGHKIQIYQLLHYPAMKNLLERVSADRFLLTYENNPWERMCVKATREHSDDIIIYGYQHNVIPQASINMFMGQAEIGNAPLPDHIFCVGEEPKKIMENYSDYNEELLEASCGLRFEYLRDARPQDRKKTRNILLALEGIPDVRCMVAYVLSQLKDHEDYQLNIRTHPVLSWSYFKSVLDETLLSVANVRVSSGSSLFEDISDADVVIYWGTTVALEAMMMGKPAVHFDNGFSLSFDPIFDCRSFKWTVGEKDDIVFVLNEIFSLSDSDFRDQKNKALEYLNRYIWPANNVAYEKFLR